MPYCSLCHTETNGTSVNSLNLSYVGCEHYFCHECFENSINRGNPTYPNPIIAIL